MNSYLLLKWLHVLSSVVLVGTGFGTAYFLFFANRSANVAGQALVTRLVVRADLWFTTPAIVVQPITGWALAHMAGWPLTSSWLVAAMLLYGLAGLCWLPVLRLQWRMREMANLAAASGQKLPAQYWQLAKTWERLGYPAFAAMLVVFWLMVAKPSLW